MNNENNDQYFVNAKAIYQSKTNRAKSRNRYNSYINASSNQIKQNEQKGTYKNVISSTTNIVNQNDNRSKASSKIGSHNVSPGHFHNKVQKEKRFKTQFQNDKMTKRLNDIKNRKNKYLKQIQRNLEIQKKHKITHQNSVIALRKLQQMNRQQQNDKFIDRLIQRVRYKQTIKNTIKQKVSQSVRLQESRAKIYSKAKNFVLPPMIFD